MEHESQEVPEGMMALHIESGEGVAKVNGHDMKPLYEAIDAFAADGSHDAITIIAALAHLLAMAAFDQDAGRDDGEQKALNAVLHIINNSYSGLAANFGEAQ